MRCPHCSTPCTSHRAIGGAGMYGAPRGLAASQCKLGRAPPVGCGPTGSPPALQRLGDTPPTGVPVTLDPLSASGWGSGITRSLSEGGTCRHVGPKPVPLPIQPARSEPCPSVGGWYRCTPLIRPRLPALGWGTFGARFQCSGMSAGDPMTRLHIEAGRRQSAIGTSPRWQHGRDGITLAPAPRTGTAPVCRFWLRWLPWLSRLTAEREPRAETLPRLTPGCPPGGLGPHSLEPRLWASRWTRRTPG